MSDKDRRYEISCDSGGVLFPYTVRKYYGDKVYPWGTIVGVTMTKWGARRLVERDQAKGTDDVVEVIHG